MVVSVSAGKVAALRVGTGEAFGRDADGALLAGFSPRSRGAPAEVMASPSKRQERQDDRQGNRLASGASADGGARCAWPRLASRKTEVGTSQDATGALA